MKCLFTNQVNNYRKKEVLFNEENNKNVLNTNFWNVRIIWE